MKKIPLALLLLMATKVLGQITFSPPAGTYSGAQSVTINCPSGKKCFYTIDGSKPSIAGFLYSTPLAVNSTTTLRVIAAQVGVMSRDNGTASTNWKCDTATAHDYSPTGPSCQTGGGIGSIVPSAVVWTYGSPMIETTSTTSSTGSTQMLFINGVTTTSCPTCTELVQDKIVQVDKGKTYLENNEMDLNVNMLATYNQFHTASLQCNQQGSTPQWQYDNQQGSWQNFSPAITYGCPLSTTQQTETRYGIHWTNGDTSCSGGFSVDHYDFLTICVGGTNGTGGTCQDFTINKTLCGYTEPTFGQKMSQQDQPDMTNTVTSGANPLTVTRKVWNNNGTLAFYGTEETATASYTIGPLTPTPPTRYGGTYQLGGQQIIR